jgi:vitamin B12/bleomycin/antimicrobial peptide transport system ATP-binding/permease protein
VHGDHQNPEYRIADDVRLATESPVDFIAGITTAVLSAVTFIAVLWTIGGALSFSVGGVSVTIRGSWSSRPCFMRCSRAARW